MKNKKIRMKHIMKKIFSAILVVSALGACSPEPKFEVEGKITDAAGKTLHLEMAALEGITPLDSVKLGESGTYSFKQPRPGYPEFYRLRVEDKVINFSIDSTETVRIDAPYAGFATNYEVKGSVNSLKIKELTLKQAKLQSDVDALVQAMRSHRIGVNVFEDSLGVLLKNYKDDVKINYIFAAPNKAAAYFALFQMLDNYLIFDPLNNRDDVKCFAAVATSLNQIYPHADRSKNLYNIVIKGMKNTHVSQPKTLELPQELVQETGVIDISLRDMKGNMRRLAELKGKAVILDFTIYQTAISATHNYMLQDLYKKYAAQGLEIYQVSLDADEHYWKTTADNLPWICVRDANGIYSSAAASYNVQTVPTLFLINKDNELSARGETVKDLEAAVKALL